MIKVSRLADYAVVILATMADRKDGLMAACDVSQTTGMPEPTVAKVLKLMSKAGLLESVRGAGGGYKLARGPADIDVADIVMAVDGPISLTACVEGSVSDCDYACECPVNGRWDQVNDAIRQALSDVTLADMIRPEKPCSKASKIAEGLAV